MAERLSLVDKTLIASFAEHIQRYRFALPYCQGKCVLDAGCGVGYGSAYLAANGAKSVLAVDIAEEALREACSTYQRDNLSFRQMDVEKMAAATGLPEAVEVVINFENLEHLSHPEQFVAGAKKLLKPTGGMLVISTPNGDVALLDQNGKPCNTFHVKEYTLQEFKEMLGRRFSDLRLFGQWLTFDGQLRQMRARETFEQLCALYYNPSKPHWTGIA